MANGISAQRNHDLIAKTLAGVAGAAIGMLIGAPLANALTLPETGMAQWGVAMLTALLSSGAMAAWLSHQRDMRAVHQTSTHRR
ncbi:MAG: hypothetical protein ABWZ40_12970 [Caulobacterales bacterium]